MNIIICIDKGGGMMFGKRRQSQDRILRQHIIELTKNSKLWMNSYSKKQFAETAPQIEVNEDFMDMAGSGEYCFIENIDPIPYIDQIETMIIYKWNRSYPSDFKFFIPLNEGKWNLASQTEFKGSSHDKITQEVYIK